MSDAADTASAPDQSPDQAAFMRAVMEMNPDSLMHRMHIEVLEGSPERLVARMPVEGNTQPYGLLHGGASSSWPRPWARWGRPCTPDQTGWPWAWTSTPPTTGLSAPGW